MTMKKKRGLTLLCALAAAAALVSCGQKAEVEALPEPAIDGYTNGVSDAVLPAEGCDLSNDTVEPEEPPEQQRRPEQEPAEQAPIEEAAPEPEEAEAEPVEEEQAKQEEPPEYEPEIIWTSDSEALSISEEYINVRFVSGFIKLNNDKLAALEERTLRENRNDDDFGTVKELEERYGVDLLELPGIENTGVRLFEGRASETEREISACVAAGFWETRTEDGNAGIDFRLLTEGEKKYEMGGYSIPKAMMTLEKTGDYFSENLGVTAKIIVLTNNDPDLKEWSSAYASFEKDGIGYIVRKNAKGADNAAKAVCAILEELRYN
ncbi:MAG: hypothetical protein II583_05090 [Oscillospiraceae bacterium]|nr:hypothetical protein [Oscillospiraceae bacterium]